MARHEQDPARPATSAGDPQVSNVFDRQQGPQYGMYDNPDYDLEEEESEDEDVFAFVPPTTADMEQQREQQQQQQQPPQFPKSVHAASANPFLHSPDSDFDPYSTIVQPQTRVPEPLQAGPSPPLPQPYYLGQSTPRVSGESSSSPAETLSNPNPNTNITTNETPPYAFAYSTDAPTPAQPAAARPYAYHSPYPYPAAGVGAIVESPPSTTSRDEFAGNPNTNSYRLRRVNTNGSTHSNTVTPTSFDVHVDFPVSDEKREQQERSVSHSAPATSTGVLPQPLEHATPKDRARTADASSPRKRKQSSNDDTKIGSGDSVTPSMLEEDSAGSIKMEFDFDNIDEEDSPFPEVRASVSNIDDPEMPAMTIRMWIVGLLLCIISAGVNVFFNFRQPAPIVIPILLLLISYPFGKLFAYVLPITTYRIPLPPPFSPITFSLNPGPWNIKEHVLVFIMCNVAVYPPYAMNAIVVSEVFYGIKLGYWFDLNLVLATQLTGFGLAGLCRRFLVWPASMVWPQNLVVCTLLNTLHAEDDEGQGGLTRYRFFLIVMGASFFFFFLPGYIFQAMSIFSFVCWIWPRSVPVNQLFGVGTGLGMSFLTFDWVQITWIGSPLMVPWWAEVHVFVGFVLFYWIMVPALYYSNAWQLSHFPITSNIPFDRFGNRYDIKRVLKTDDTFNLTAYEEYSPLYLPATYAMTYLLAFALSTCVLVHTGLYHGHILWNGLKKIRVEEDDIHAKLMRNYPEVPDWWYGAALVVFFSLAVVAVEIWHTTVPVWALLLSVLLPCVYVLPSGFIFAMTGQGITLNLLAQIIPGTLLPGNPLANMIFKAYSVQTLGAATDFVQDLKLGHYVKVPPRATFLVQAVATVLAAFVQVGVKVWLFAHVKGICTANAKNHLTCPHNQVFFTASAVWGLIGPSRQFGKGTLYHPHLYATIVGAVLPVPFWLWQRRYPNSWIKFVSTPVVLNGVSFIPPATGINYSSWIAVGFVFQYWIRRRNFAWWSKFNYITSAAMDSGTILSILVIFFTLQFPKGGKIQLNWWGNTVFVNTADYNGVPFRPISPDSPIP